MEEILKQNPDVIVIVDEAYIDFAGKPSAISLIDRYDNLLVRRPFPSPVPWQGCVSVMPAGNERLIRMAPGCEVFFQFLYYVRLSGYCLRDGSGKRYGVLRKSDGKDCRHKRMEQRETGGSGI